MEPKLRQVEGYVVDIACLRRYPGDEYRQRAQAHTTSCALMGHCVESGYAVVDDDGFAHVLDSHATPHIAAVLRATDQEQGVRIVVSRRREDGEMVTTQALEAGSGS